ncbi:MAG: hydrogenase maturation protease [Sulfolobales archaeon]
MASNMKTRGDRKILFLGNSIFLEDKIGLVIGSLLRGDLEKRGFEVEILERSWISLLDIISGVKELIIVDSIIVDNPDDIGRVHLIDPKDFYGSHVKAPHSLSLADVLRILEVYNLEPPEKIYVIGIGISDIQTLSEELSDTLKNKISEICSDVIKIIDSIYTSNSSRKSERML